MEYQRTLRLRMGLFVLTALVLLAVLIVLFGGVPGLFRSYQHYTVIFDDAPGVIPGTPVRRSGVRIGQVTAVDLDERLSEVCVLTMSEFGRTVRENGNSGTDHCHATAVLVLGGTVRGKQVAGKWQGLSPEARCEGRDVAVTTD